MALFYLSRSVARFESAELGGAGRSAGGYTVIRDPGCTDPAREGVERLVARKLHS